MIDLRCHVLDGTDCGPQSFSVSLEMCRAAVRGGVETIVATPRWKAGSAEPPVGFDEMGRKIERLRAETDGALAVKAGFVFEFSMALPDLVRRYGPRLALGGKRHLLVSLPKTRVPEEAELVWESLAADGYFVVLAHPECSPALRRDGARLARWASAGMKFQIDAASVAGAYGPEVQKFAARCLRQFGAQTVVASNARGGNDVSLGEARAKLFGQVGRDLATKSLTETPGAILGEGVGPNAARRMAASRLTSLLRHAGAVKALLG